MQKSIIHIGVAIIAAYIFFRYLLGFVAPFIIGIAIAMLIEPLVALLTGWARFRRSLASFVSLLILCLVAVSLGRWAIMSLYREAGEFLSAAPIYIASVEDWLSNYPFIPTTGLLTRAGEWLSTRSIQAVIHLPEMLIGILLVLVSAFFFSRDKDRILTLAAKWCPDCIAEYAGPVGHRLHKAGIGFLKSELIIIGSVAVITIGTLWIMGNPYALLLGIAIALLDALPIVGAGLALWPWAGYLALTGQYSQAAGLMVLYGIITVVQNVIGPRILGEQIDMHPLAAIMAIFMGVKAFGAAGLLAGPAIVLAAQAMFEKEQL